jgi:hypothetical protein
LVPVFDGDDPRAAVGMLRRESVSPDLGGLDQMIVDRDELHVVAEHCGPFLSEPLNLDPRSR